jgi:hypothetical protein
MVLAGVFIFGLAGGCMPRMTIEEIADMRPPRAPELDRLDRLVGDWDTVGEVRMAVLDETLQTTGRSSAQWMLDKRFLREDAELDMGALGRVTGTSIWSYEPGANKYHMWWFDSLGETSHAVITFNHRTDTWHMRTRGRKYGYATSGRGTLRHVDDDTLEWTWQEFDGTGLFKLADMKGVSRRRP